ncbi:MAG: hypothetical protein WC511_02755 [Candidatus Pacearchaeota archaeon]
MVARKPIFTQNSQVASGNVTPVNHEEKVHNAGQNSQYLPLVNVEDLPSNFLPYPKGVEIAYCPYTYGELKKFAQSKLSVKQRYEFILEGIKVSGMPKEKLTYQDFLFIALLRKLSSVGVSDISIKYACLKCGFENNSHVKLDTLDFNYMNIPELPANIVVKDQEMSFTPLTIEDYFNLYKEGKDKDSVYIMAAQCRSHNLKAAHEILYSANPEDSELLNELDNMFFHGLKPLKFLCENKEAKEVEVVDGVEIEKNVHCDFTNLVELGDASLIVQPFRGDREPVKNRIQFGNRNENKPA